MIAYMHWVDGLTEVKWDSGTIHVRSTKIGKACKSTDEIVASFPFEHHEGAVRALRAAEEICDALNAPRLSQET